MSDNLTQLLLYPRFNDLHQAIRECQEISQEAGEPQCMCLEGCTGAGKTTLVKNYTQAFPSYHTETGTKIPVFYMETPSPVTVKGMAAEMLYQLGDPGGHQGTLWSMNSRLVNFIRDCQVQLVILDDFHHLVDCKTNRILREVSDWLKVLIKSTHVPFLVVGIDGEVRRILKANSQLSRLFIPEELRPFEWDTGRPGTMKEFGALLSYAEHTFGIVLSQELPRTELLYRIHFATEGVMSNIMYLLRKAAKLTQTQKDSSGVITIATLAEAFDKRLAHHVNKQNPFNAPPNQKFIPPPALPPTKNGKQGRRGPSIAETLKT